MTRKPVKILLIGSSSWAIALFSDIIQQTIAQASLFTSAAEGLAAARTQRFDLVLVASELPDMSTEAFCCQLRTITGYRRCKIILFVTETADISLKEAMQLGATDVISTADYDALIHNVRWQIECLTCALTGRVLVVEDSIDQQLLIKHFLESMGLEVDVFAFAEEALNALQQPTANYDLIITDTVLTGSMSGLALIREMRQYLHAHHESPILALEALDETSRRIALLHLGVHDYLIKPILFEELHARVRNLIEHKRMLFELRAQQKLLEHIAFIDPVTNIYNRTAFNDIGPKQFAAAVRNQTPLCLVVADIDYFKKINDDYGHLKGDAILKGMGKLLKNYVRKGDLVFRWGGEEFVLLLACNADKGALLSEKLRYKVAHTALAHLTITASFGVSYTEPGRETSLEVLFKQADQALYEAKRSGRNKVCISKPDTLMMKP